ncbi:MAG: hypothetical protein P0S96_04680 [Simkaniaceae bacterium]|nr:hypothetical protein [Candidatus Sacchlamyda saccharinae]
MTENIDHKSANGDIPTLLSIRDFSKKHPFMSENSLRWLLFREPEGLEECLVRLSRRIFIKEREFFDFLSSQNKGNRK